MIGFVEVQRDSDFLSLQGQIKKPASDQDNFPPVQIGRLVSKEEKDWNKAVSGLRAEQRIFDEIQRQFSDQPCLLMNGFSEHNLFKVVKSKLQQYKKGKCEALSDEVKTKFYN